MKSDRLIILLVIPLLIAVWPAAYAANWLGQALWTAIRGHAQDAGAPVTLTVNGKPD
jgi:hypothetical protein